MQIQISPGGSQTIYRQIVDQIRRAVAADKVAIGDSVPSVRQLAKDLVVNPNTVAKAYAELVRDGVLESQLGRGYFVARRKNIYTKAERLRRLDDVLDSVVSEALALDFASEEVVQRLVERMEALSPRER